MPGNEFINDLLDFLEEVYQEDQEELRQRKLALAYASANGLPWPKFSIIRPLQSEIYEETCPHCGYPV